MFGFASRGLRFILGFQTRNPERRARSEVIKDPSETVVPSFCRVLALGTTNI